DVRMLGRFLETKGYTTHAPIYRGHGDTPEKLIETTPEEWWEDVETAYNHLLDLGYEEIAVAGLSMGGALGLKLANYKKIKAVIPMCTPMFFDNEAQLTKGFLAFSKQHKQFERKADDVIEEEVTYVEQHSKELFTKIGTFVEEVNSMVDMIYAPALVIQASQDEMINPESANFIYENL